MKNLYYIYFLFFTSLIFSCKSAKTVATGEANYNLNTKQLIKENENQSPQFKTLAAKLKIDIVDGDKEKSYSVNLRMEKDKQILLLSSPISVVKALITPENVSFYNKLDNTYFDGDYSYLSDLLGTELDFVKVQNLLLGEALFHLADGTYKSSIYENSYLLEPKRQSDLLEIFYILSPSIFKVKSQQFTQAKEHRHLQIDYLTHQDVNKQVLPEKLKVIAVEETSEIIINLEFKNIVLNEDLNFAFKIPSGYEEIELKND